MDSFGYMVTWGPLGSFSIYTNPNAMPDFRLIAAEFTSTDGMELLQISGISYYYSIEVWHKLHLGPFPIAHTSNIIASVRSYGSIFKTALLQFIHPTDLLSALNPSQSWKHFLSLDKWVGVISPSVEYASSGTKIYILSIGILIGGRWRLNYLSSYTEGDILAWQRPLDHEITNVVSPWIFINFIFHSLEWICLNKSFDILAYFAHLLQWHTK